MPNDDCIVNFIEEKDIYFISVSLQSLRKMAIITTHLQYQ